MKLTRVLFVAALSSLFLLPIMEQGAAHAADSTATSRNTKDAIHKHVSHPVKYRKQRNPRAQPEETVAPLSTSSTPAAKDDKF